MGDQAEQLRLALDLFSLGTKIGRYTFIGECSGRVYPIHLYYDTVEDCFHAMDYRDGGEWGYPSAQGLRKSTSLKALGVDLKRMRFKPLGDRAIHKILAAACA